MDEVSFGSNDGKIMNCLRLAAVVLLSFLVSASPIHSRAFSKQDSGQQAKNEKALKYHKALQRRPVPGYLFDRFYNTWLDESSIADLETFLKSQAASSGKTNDILLLAFFYAKQGKDVKAIEQFRVALKNDPTSANVLYEKAVVESQTLDFDTALADLDAAAKANPKRDVGIKIANLKAKLLVRNREERKAIAVWQKLIADNPSDQGLMEERSFFLKMY